MYTELLSNEHREAYGRLSLACGNIFSTLSWLEMFGNQVRIFGIYDKANNLIGGFHVFVKKVYGLSFCRNCPLTPSIGLFCDVRATNPVAALGMWKEVLTEVAKRLDRLPAAVTSCSLDTYIVDAQPFIWRKFKVVPGYTYVLDLALTTEELRSKMSNGKRGDINAALRDGLEVHRLHEFSAVEQLNEKTFARQEKKFARLDLKKTLFSFAAPHNSFAFAVFKDGQPIAANFCVYDRNTAFALLGGYDHKQKHHGAYTLAFWQSIQLAKELGLQYFNFDGSMVPRIEHYLRGFGGRLTPYYRVNKAFLPIEIVLKFIKRELF